MKTRLSIDSLDKLIKRLDIEVKNLETAQQRIADRLADEMLNYVLKNGRSTYSANNPYSDSVKEATQYKDHVAIGRIKDEDLVAVFHEFGTGINGSDNPHVNEVLAEAGWTYDVNGHGEYGWWYPTTPDDPNPYKWIRKDGQLMGWTKGLTAKKIFYQALQEANEKFVEIAKEELRNASEGG
jgi:hypothetical protein